ncbi:MAG: GNAT family N-acetyltransferase [Pseudomonadota bacterium]
MPQPSETPVEVRVHSSLRSVAPDVWDACAAPEGSRVPVDPFTTHRFLLALEESRSVGVGTGWEPHYLEAVAAGETIAVAPLYAKSHSQGEYIFDHNWAHAYERAGGRYYPKLQIAVPHTPATGRRLLVKPGFEAAGQAALVQGAVQIAADNDLSSIHMTFCTDGEVEAGKAMGLLPRASQQFHWINEGYSDFDAFLASLNSRKRKNIRKERAQAQAFGGTIHALTGDDLRPEHWDAFWRFYQDTGARKWGTPYLTRAFFDHAQETLRDDMLLVLAERDGRYVAGALNFIGKHTLYGRYWGCVEDHPCLHFELCYYQAIDYAITHQLDRVEAGAQGTHKLARGYLPVTCHSLHWVGDPRFREAIAQFLESERNAVEHENEILTSYGPFKKVDVEEQQ